MTMPGDEEDCIDMTWKCAEDRDTVPGLTREALLRGSSMFGAGSPFCSSICINLLMRTSWPCDGCSDDQTFVLSSCLKFSWEFNWPDIDTNFNWPWASYRNQSPSLVNWGKRWDCGDPKEASLSGKTGWSDRHFPWKLFLAQPQLLKSEHEKMGPDDWHNWRCPKRAWIIRNTVPHLFYPSVSFIYRNVPQMFF